MINVNHLLAIAGTKKFNDVTARLADAINRHAATYGITTQKRLSQFLANTCVETGGFTKLEENLNYSVSGLLKGFGRHRISKAEAQRLGRTSTRKADQRAIANVIYGGAFGRENLGNVQPNDGWDYRGSGLGQVTGRANFARIEKETGERVRTSLGGGVRGGRCATGRRWRRSVPEPSDRLGSKFFGNARQPDHDASGQH